MKELELKTIPDVTNAIKAGGACMSCHQAPGGLQDILDETWGRAARPQEPSVSAETPERPEVSPFRFAKNVERVVDEYVRPMLRQDGGDIEIVDIKDQVVFAQLSGACAGCVGSKATLRMVVEQTLKDQVDERIRIVAV